ncbi:MAG TPA: TlpA disulfide reductase family protein [Candidatus Acidoferrales bacterium]|nr:TlpA disulfide reductase family protein [Candidatus Acidoferrales bacterium]
MRLICLSLCASILLASSPAAKAQESNSTPPPSKKSSDASAKKAPDPEAELQKALANAGNDSAAMIKNLKEYLREFPETPRKTAVYRALVEACEQTHDTACALDYAEHLIVTRPDDSQMMLVAVNLLEQRGDEASLTRAAGYVTRILDRVEKVLPDERPARESIAEWQDGQSQLRTALYFVRGQVEISQRNYDAAVKDIRTSDSIHANALAAKTLGEVAETRGDPAAAIQEYVQAFTLPESGPAGTVNRRDILRELRNDWQQVHGSEQGLGDAILAAYDRALLSSSNGDPTTITTAAIAALARNRDAKDVFSFVVRRLDGSPFALTVLKGKIVVLSFWATWCAPCRELEPMFNTVARTYIGNSDVVFFAVSADDDEAQVPAFVVREKWDIPVLYSDGLDAFTNANTLPTVVVVGRNGQVVYRTGGLPRDTFTDSLTAAIQAALVTAH